jgi:hypothetical protein
VVRITPLTDRDVGEILNDADLSAEHGLDELFGRLSQLIEELPWLCGMTAQIQHVGGAPGVSNVGLGDDVKIGFLR